MALTGVMGADFSKFTDAVDAAEIKLRQFGGGAAKVESALSRMGNAFSGQKVVQDATLMAKVFEDMGGAAAFTEKELARMSATGAEAVAKLTALGKEVPEGIQKIADQSKIAESSLRLMAQSQEQMLDKIGAAGGRIQDLGTTAGETSGQVGSLTKSYQQFDGVLQSAGINIGPQVKGLEDIANAAGKSTTELGFLGTAGLVAGAALTGWKLGTWIDDLTGASTAIANLTGNLDRLAEQTVGAKQDTINLAIRQGAKDTISYADAIKYLTDQVQVNADKSINWRERLADSYREVRGLTDAQKEEIAIAREAGATTEQLTNKYGIHAIALGFLATETDKAAEASKRLTAEKEREAAALEKAYAKLMSDTKNANQLAIMEADAAQMAADAYNKKAAAGAGYIKQMGEIARVNREAQEFEEQLAKEQARVEKENQALIKSFTEAGGAAKAAGESAVDGATQAAHAQAQLNTQINLTIGNVKEWIELQQYTAAANSILSQNGLYTSGSAYENIARMGSAFTGITPRAGGGPVSAGSAYVVGEAGPELFLPGVSGTIAPNGGGATITNIFHLTDTESNLARRVSEQIMRQVRAGTQLATT